MLKNCDFFVEFSEFSNPSSLAPSWCSWSSKSGQPIKDDCNLYSIKNFADILQGNWKTKFSESPCILDKHAHCVHKKLGGLLRGKQDKTDTLLLLRELIIWGVLVKYSCGGLFFEIWYQNIRLLSNDGDIKVERGDLG